MLLSTDETRFRDRAKSLAQATSASRSKLIKQFVLVCPTKDSSDLCKKTVHEAIDSLCAYLANLCYTVDPETTLQEWQSRFINEGRPENENERKSDPDESKSK